MRSPLSRALGHGSSGEGSAHWWSARLTAIALIPLAFWLVFSLFTLAKLSHPDAVAWMQRPSNAILMVLFLLTMFYHSFLGLQVIIEDYVHPDWLKVSMLLTVQFAHVFLAVTCIFMVLKLALGGGVQ